MSNSSILQLDRKTVAVCLDVGGHQVHLKGLGTFDVDPSLGDCLRILFEDAQFELLLRESEFAGEILSGAEFGCDYHIPLARICQSKAG